MLCGNAPRCTLHLAAKLGLAVWKAGDDHTNLSVEFKRASIDVELVKIVLARSVRHTPPGRYLARDLSPSAWCINCSPCCVTAGVSRSACVRACEVVVGRALRGLPFATISNRRQSTSLALDGVLPALTLEAASRSMSSETAWRGPC
jgi:hypothetical protein